LRIPEQLNKLLGQHAVRVRLTAITGEERRDLRAQDVYAALRPVIDQNDDLFLGRLMVAWEPLREALTRGGSFDVLSYLYRAYRGELTGPSLGSPVSAAGFRRPQLRQLLSVPG